MFSVLEINRLWCKTSAKNLPTNKRNTLKFCKEHDNTIQYSPRQINDSVYKNIIRTNDLTNDGKLFHSFEAAAQNVREAAAVLTLGVQLAVVLCDTWNWSDENYTVSGIKYWDTIAILEMEMHYEIQFVQNSPISDHRCQLFFICSTAIILARNWNTFT